MFFEKPTQVMFWPDGEKKWIGGIGYRNKIICGCCGSVFEVSELLRDNPNGIIQLPWIDISEEICGDE